MHCQKSLVLSDAVWAETVSPKLVEEISFDWASQTEHFRNFTFSFFAFLSTKSKISRKGRLLHYVWGFSGAWHKKMVKIEGEDTFWVIF
jgi:hypothetical protein